MDRASDSGSEGWGFESLPVYQKFQIPIRVSGIFYTLGGTRKDGRAKRGKKVSGGHFFSPWESPLGPGRIRYGCGRDPRSIAEQVIFHSFMPSRYPLGYLEFFIPWAGLERTAERSEVKKVSGGHFFSPWESPLGPGRIRYGCGRDPRSIAERVMLYSLTPSSIGKGVLQPFCNTPVVY